MCAPILRSISTNLTNWENMQKSYDLFYVTWRKIRYVVRHGGSYSFDRYFDLEHSETNQKSSGSKVMVPKVVFMKYWNLHVKFHKNPSSSNEWHSRGHTQWHKHEVVGSNPTRMSILSNLNLYNSLCARGVPPPSTAKKTHTHRLCLLVEVIKSDEQICIL